MGNKVNMVRPDGTIVQVDREDAAELSALGHKLETTGDMVARNQQRAEEEHFTSTGQKVLTVAEGLAAGLTVGASDLAFDALGFDTAERAGFNPGTRLASEIVGGLAPLAPGMGMLKYTPAGLVSDAATSAGKALAARGAGKVAQYGAGGLIEGAGAGLQSAISDSVVTGDPLTVESIAAGVGWGALFGGGLGALTGKAANMLDSRAAKAAAEEATARTLNDSFAAFRGHLDDITGEADKVVKAAGQAVDAAKDNVRTIGRAFEQQAESVKLQNKMGREAIDAENKANTAAADAINEGEFAARQGQAKAAVDEAADIRNGFFNETVVSGFEGKASGEVRDALRFNKKEGIRAFKDMEKALKAKDYVALEKAQARFQQHLDSITELIAKENRADAITEAIRSGWDRSQGEVPSGFGPWSDLLGKAPKVNPYSAPGTMGQGELFADMSGPMASHAKTPRERGAGGKFLNARQKAYTSGVVGEDAGGQLTLPLGSPKNPIAPAASGVPPTIGGPAVPVLKEFTPAGVQMMLPLEQMALDAANKSFKEVKQLGSVANALRGMPRTADEFVHLSPAKAEKLFAAVDSFLGVQAAELAGMKSGLQDAIARMQEELGLKVEGAASKQLRGIYEAVRAIPQKATRDAIAGGVPWGRRLMSNVAGAGGAGLAAKAGWGGIGRGAAREVVRNVTLGLLGIKGAVVGGISKAAGEWLPKAMVKTRRLQPRIEPLITRLDGTEDKAAKGRRELMERRAEEIREAAGSIRDTLYKQLMPLAEDHPELGANLHAHGVKRFQFILDKLPKDPGLAFNKLNSLWRPDPVAVEKFARYYQVFHNPAGVLQEIFKTGRVYPEWAEGLREMDPALYTQARVLLLERLGDPQVMKRLDYHQQVNMGLFLGIPLHSTMTPQFVATQQQMFMERNQLIPMPPQPGVGSGGGRPPGPANNSNATSSQKITEH